MIVSINFTVYDIIYMYIYIYIYKKKTCQRVFGKGRRYFSWYFKRRERSLPSEKYKNGTSKKTLTKTKNNGPRVASNFNEEIYWKQP